MNYRDGRERGSTPEEQDYRPQNNMAIPNNEQSATKTNNDEPAESKLDNGIVAATSGEGEGRSDRTAKGIAARAQHRATITSSFLAVPSLFALDSPSSISSTTSSSTATTLKERIAPYDRSSHRSLPLTASDSSSHNDQRSHQGTTRSAMAATTNTSGQHLAGTASVAVGKLGKQRFSMYESAQQQKQVLPTSHQLHNQRKTQLLRNNKRALRKHTSMSALYAPSSRPRMDCRKDDSLSTSLHSPSRKLTCEDHGDNDDQECEGDSNNVLEVMPYFMIMNIPQAHRCGGERTPSKLSPGRLKKERISTFERKYKQRRPSQEKIRALSPAPGKEHVTARLSLYETSIQQQQQDKTRSHKLQQLLRPRKKGFPKRHTSMIAISSPASSFLPKGRDIDDGLSNSLHGRRTETRMPVPADYHDHDAGDDTLSAIPSLFRISIPPVRRCDSEPISNARTDEQHEEDSDDSSAGSLGPARNKSNFLSPKRGSAGNDFIAAVPSPSAGGPSQQQQRKSRSTQMNQAKQGARRKYLPRKQISMPAIHSRPSTLMRQQSAENDMLSGSLHNPRGPTRGDDRDQSRKERRDSVLSDIPSFLSMNVPPAGVSRCRSEPHAMLPQPPVDGGKTGRHRLCLPGAGSAAGDVKSEDAKNVASAPLSRKPFKPSRQLSIQAQPVSDKDFVASKKLPPRRHKSDATSSRAGKLGIKWPPVTNKSHARQQSKLAEGWTAKKSPALVKSRRTSFEPGMKHINSIQDAMQVLEGVSRDHANISSSIIAEAQKQHEQQSQRRSLRIRYAGRASFLIDSICRRLEELNEDFDPDLLLRQDFLTGLSLDEDKTVAPVPPRAVSYDDTITAATTLYGAITSRPSRMGAKKQSNLAESTLPSHRLPTRNSTSWYDDILAADTEGDGVHTSAAKSPSSRAASVSEGGSGRLASIRHRRPDIWITPYVDGEAQQFDDNAGKTFPSNQHVDKEWRVKRVWNYLPFDKHEKEFRVKDADLMDKVKSLLGVFERLVSGNQDKAKTIVSPAKTFVYPKEQDSIKAEAITTRVPHMRDEDEQIDSVVNQWGMQWIDDICGHTKGSFSKLEWRNESEVLQSFQDVRDVEEKRQLASPHKSMTIASANATKHENPMETVPETAPIQAPDNLTADVKPQDQVKDPAYVARSTVEDVSSSEPSSTVRSLNEIKAAALERIARKRKVDNKGCKNFVAPDGPTNKATQYAALADCDVNVDAGGDNPGNPSAPFGANPIGRNGELTVKWDYDEGGEPGQDKDAEWGSTAKAGEVEVTGDWERGVVIDGSLQWASARGEKKIVGEVSGNWKYGEDEPEEDEDSREWGSAPSGTEQGSCNVDKVAGNWNFKEGGEDDECLPEWGSALATTNASDTTAEKAKSKSVGGARGTEVCEGDQKSSSPADNTIIKKNVAGNWQYEKAGDLEEDEGSTEWGSEPLRGSKALATEQSIGKGGKLDGNWEYGKGGGAEEDERLPEWTRGSIHESPKSKRKTIGGNWRYGEGGEPEADAPEWGSAPLASKLNNSSQEKLDGNWGYDAGQETEEEGGSPDWVAASKPDRESEMHQQKEGAKWMYGKEDGGSPEWGTKPIDTARDKVNCAWEYGEGEPDKDEGSPEWGSSPPGAKKSRVNTKIGVEANWEYGAGSESGASESSPEWGSAPAGAKRAANEGEMVTDNWQYGEGGTSGEDDGLSSWVSSPLDPKPNKNISDRIGDWQYGEGEELAEDDGASKWGSAPSNAKATGSDKKVGGDWKYGECGDGDDEESSKWDSVAMGTKANEDKNIGAAGDWKYGDGEDEADEESAGWGSRPSDGMAVKPISDDGQHQPSSLPSGTISGCKQQTANSGSWTFGAGCDSDNEDRSSGWDAVPSKATKRGDRNDRNDATFNDNDFEATGKSDRVQEKNNELGEELNISAAPEGDMKDDKVPSSKVKTAAEVPNQAQVSPKLSSAQVAPNKATCDKEELDEIKAKMKKVKTKKVKKSKEESRASIFDLLSPPQWKFYSYED